MKNNNKICFISCVNDDVYYEESLLYLKSLVIPKGMSFEFIAIRGAKSMASGYNEGMRNSDARYKVYLHQDCFLLEKKSIETVISIFKDNPSIGLAGVVGCKKIPKSCIWWEAEEKIGQICHADMPENLYKTVYGKFSESALSVEAIDGVLMATQYDIPWREDLFSGWHFYDVSQSLEFQRCGYQVVIPKQHDFWVLHATGDKALPTEYYKYRKTFFKEYVENRSI